jgi:hypothetical protein
LTAFIASRSVPTPLSFFDVTVNVAAPACDAAAISETAMQPASGRSEWLRRDERHGHDDMVIPL